MRARVICAWCGAFLGWGKTTNGEDSHGICLDCVRKHMPIAFKTVTARHDLQQSVPIDLPVGVAAE